MTAHAELCVIHASLIRLIGRLRAAVKACAAEKKASAHDEHTLGEYSGRVGGMCMVAPWAGSGCHADRQAERSGQIDRQTGWLAVGGRAGRDALSAVTIGVAARGEGDSRAGSM